MKERLLIQWSDNWADEMDLEGHFIMDKSAWEQMQEEARKITSEFTYCVGSNEEIEYRNGEDALKYFTATSITEDEYKVLEKLGLEYNGFVGPDFERDEWDDEEDCENYEHIGVTEYERKIIPLNTRYLDNESLIREQNKLTDKGYIKTYVGKYGETWELSDSDK